MKSYKGKWTGFRDKDDNIIRIGDVIKDKRDGIEWKIIYDVNLKKPMAKNKRQLKELYIVCSPIYTEIIKYYNND